MLDKQLVCVTGLPRSGSTLLCQLLGHHPDLYSPGHSSPLVQALNQLRHNLSDNHFHLAQFDIDGQLVHDRMIHAFRGFMAGWFDETDRPLVVDKNRAWLNQLELAMLLEPNCRMLVCVREPSQILGSIEYRHRQTLLMDFPDHLAHLSPYDRADRLFGNEGVIGAPLRAIEHVQDRPDDIQQRLYYVVFEDLMAEPVRVMTEIFGWLGVESVDVDPQQLEVRPHESDSYYRGKYPHRTRERITPPRRHPVPARIEAQIRKNFAWFYEAFYPGLIRR
jgi:sulfotransferase